MITLNTITIASVWTIYTARLIFIFITKEKPLVGHTSEPTWRRDRHCQSVNPHVDLLHIFMDLFSPIGQLWMYFIHWCRRPIPLFIPGLLLFALGSTNTSLSLGVHLVYSLYVVIFTHFLYILCSKDVTVCSAVSFLKLCAKLYNLLSAD